MSGDISIPNEDCESLVCIIMKESPSSSTPRSGEVEEEEELEALDTRCRCRCRDSRAMVEVSVVVLTEWKKRGAQELRL